MRLTSSFNPQRGDWIFTCRMMPVQFGEWIHEKPVDLEHMRAELESSASYTSEEIDRLVSEVQQPDLLDPDWFNTLDGSNHSAQHCSIRPISQRYAHWFTENKLWQYYDFFLTERVPFNAEWIRYTPPSPYPGTTYWYRSTPGGVRFNYRRQAGKNQFTYLSFGAGEDLKLGLTTRSNFAYVPADVRSFSTKNHQWQIYEGYLRWRAWSEGLTYEGY